MIQEFCRSAQVLANVLLLLVHAITIQGIETWYGVVGLQGQWCCHCGFLFANGYLAATVSRHPGFSLLGI